MPRRMCGIAGFLSRPIARDRASRMVAAMIDAIAHRGPDDSGIWLDEQAGVALGHRRLAILDLSAAGHQPMPSPSGRYVMVYNGEIYNHSDLRKSLELGEASFSWRGHSDTEVMLAAFDRWGITATLERLNGMFAFALWDRQKRELTLARDRLGEKPLYYGLIGDNFVFGSELKALVQHPGFTGEVDRAALTQFIRHGYVPAPSSIWSGISKLMPGHFLVVPEHGRRLDAPQAYWSFQDIAEAGAADPLPDTPDLVDNLERLLRDAVGRRMEADVPLGAFLSGGIDSSLIVALMQAQSTRRVRTFTIGFDDPNFNEAQHAKAVAAHLGTEHVEFYVTPRDALDVVPALPHIWDEPFSDWSQIPTYLVSKLTRDHVTVSLSGDGGDELFGGYVRYSSGFRAWRTANRLPERTRTLLARGLADPRSASIANALMQLAPTRHRQLGFADRLRKLARVLGETTADGVYRQLTLHTDDADQIVVDAMEPRPAHPGAQAAFPDARQKMMCVDTLTYLPDDILAKVDRASMAVSLEGRMPFLDHRVVEYAWRLPMQTKVRNGRGKQILRQMLYRYVPKAIMERPKMGFSIPMEAWLDGALRDWAEALLEPRRLREEGFLDERWITRLWSEHKSGLRRSHVQLWDILMFQAWWEAHRASALTHTPSIADLPRTSSAAR